MNNLHVRRTNNKIAGSSYISNHHSHLPLVILYFDRSARKWSEVDAEFKDVISEIRGAVSVSIATDGSHDHANN